MDRLNIRYLRADPDFMLRYLLTASNPGIDFFLPFLEHFLRLFDFIVPKALLTTWVFRSGANIGGGCVLNVLLHD